MQVRLVKTKAEQIFLSFAGDMHALEGSFWRKSSKKFGLLIIRVPKLMQQV